MKRPIILTVALSLAATALPAVAQDKAGIAEALCRDAALSKYNAYETSRLSTERIKAGKKKGDYFVKGIARRHSESNVAFGCRTRDTKVMKIGGELTGQTGEDENLERQILSTLLESIAD